MQYSYKSLLVYLMTVVTMTANNCSKKEPVKSIAHIYSKPKETLNEEKKSDPEEEKNNNPEASPIQEVKENKEDVALEELRQRFETVWNEKVTNILVTKNGVIDWFCKQLTTTEHAEYNDLKSFLEQQGGIQDIADYLNKAKDHSKALLLELPFEELRQITDYLENEYKPENNGDKVLTVLHNQCNELQVNWLPPTREKFNNLIADMVTNRELKCSSLILNANDIEKSRSLIEDTFKQRVINYQKDIISLITGFKDYDLYKTNQRLEELEQREEEKKKRTEKMFAGTENYPMDELKKSVNERINEAVTETNSELNTKQQLSPEKEVVLRIKQACNPIVLMESKNTHIIQFIDYCKQYIEHIKGWYNKLTDEEQGRLFDLYTKQPNQPPYIIACVKQLVNDALKGKNSTLISNTELRNLLQIEQAYANDIAKCAFGYGYLKEPEDLLLVYNLKQDGFKTTDQAIKIFTPKLTQSITTHEETHKRYQEKLNSTIAKLVINIKQAPKTP
ncbi:hypothetical protein [Cardinium endosymbiont of Philonthus spinipes]|uniref:hypothetical protein n=1 Tax=Cardinium endosymbiont of Philonthus spinipes TaxID=3077941 RepID=UPI00313CAEFC